MSDITPENRTGQENGTNGPDNNPPSEDFYAHVGTGNQVSQTSTQCLLKQTSFIKNIVYNLVLFVELLKRLVRIYKPCFGVVIPFG